MAWTDLSFPFGSLLTSTQMTQMDANFDAVAAGDDGAPAIQYGNYIINYASAVSTTVGNSFVTVASLHLFFPAAPNTWNLYLDMQTGGLGGDPRFRIKIGNTTSTVASLSSAATIYTPSSCSMDVASITGLQSVELQLWAVTAGTISVRNCFSYFT